MWWSWQKKGDGQSRADSSESASSSASSMVSSGEMALAWQWISYLQTEVQKANANVRAVHAHHDARAREVRGVVDQNASQVRQDVRQETTALVSSLVEKKYQESLQHSRQFEQGVRSSIGVLAEKVSRVDVLELRLSSVEAELPKVISALDALRSRVETVSHSSSSSQSPVRARSSLQERVERRVHKHGKDFLKQSIRLLVQKYGRLSALQLREIVVDEQGLCSKSTLYRLLDELEKEFSLSNDGREKVFSVAVAQR